MPDALVGEQAFTDPAEGSASVVVVLWAPSEAAWPAVAPVLAALAAQASAVRVLLLARQEGDLEAGKAAHGLGLHVDALLAPALLHPDWGRRSVAMPSGTSPDEQSRLALCLSDAILADAARPRTALERHAASLNRPVIDRADLPLPTLSNPRALQSVLPRGEAGWLGHRWAGRVDRILRELLAFRRQGDPSSYAKSWNRVRSACRWHWRHRSYFAPGGNAGWSKTRRDPEARRAETPLNRTFDRLDLAATIGAAAYRDVIWITHAAAAGAVLAAVAGHVGDHWRGWGYIELLCLAASFGLFLGVRRSGLRRHWMAQRLAAEQLRIAYLCVALLVAPPGLLGADDSGGDPPSDAAVAMRIAKRALRDHGLPRCSPEPASAQSWANWLDLIVLDQQRYHADNEGRLDKLERRIDRITLLVVVCAVVAVVVEFRWDQPWLLLVTAGGPAIAGALHGIGTRLGIEHRGAESGAVRATLERLRGQLGELGDRLASPHCLLAIRELALNAADQMNVENLTWYRLLNRTRDVPAV